MPERDDKPMDGALVNLAWLKMEAGEEKAPHPRMVKPYLQAHFDWWTFIRKRAARVKRRTKTTKPNPGETA